MRVCFSWCAALCIAASVGAPASAQWSIGAQDDRIADAGDERYTFLVFANPRPGQEQAFNDWYDYEHIGDLVQLPGWTGAQRFRLVTDLNPRPTEAGYTMGYLALWDQESENPKGPRRVLDEAQDGGKARRSKTFEYRHGAAPKALYQVTSPRIVRSDGVGMSIPSETDSVSIRPNRYLVLDYSDRPKNMPEAAYEEALNKRVQRLLAVSGWIAAQRMRGLPTPGSRGAPDEPSEFPQDLIVWEVEAVSAQAAADALQSAVESGDVPAPADPDSAVLTFWQPIGPYIDRSDFAR